MQLLVISNEADCPNGVPQRLLFNRSVSHADLLLARRGHHELTWRLSRRALGFSRLFGEHPRVVMAFLAHGRLRRGSCFFLHHRHEVHRTDRAFVVGLLRPNRGVHRARVIIHVGGLGLTALLFARDTNERQQDEEDGEQCRGPDGTTDYGEPVENLRWQRVHSGCSCFIWRRNRFGVSDPSRPQLRVRRRQPGNRSNGSNTLTPRRGRCAGPQSDRGNRIYPLRRKPGWL